VQLAIPCVLVVYCGRVLKAPEIALLGLLEVIFGIVLVWVGAGERRKHRGRMGAHRIGDGPGSRQRQPVPRGR